MTQYKPPTSPPPNPTPPRRLPPPLNSPRGAPKSPAAAVGSGSGKGKEGVKGEAASGSGADFNKAEDKTKLNNNNEDRHRSPSSEMGTGIGDLSVNPASTPSKPKAARQASVPPAYDSSPLKPTVIAPTTPSLEGNKEKKESKSPKAGKSDVPAIFQSGKLNINRTSLSTSTSTSTANNANPTSPPSSRSGSISTPGGGKESAGSAHTIYKPPSSLPPPPSVTSMRAGSGSGSGSGIPSGYDAPGNSNSMDIDLVGSGSSDSHTIPQKKHSLRDEGVVMAPSVSIDAVDEEEEMMNGPGGGGRGGGGGGGSGSGSGKVSNFISIQAEPERKMSYHTTPQQYTPPLSTATSSKNLSASSSSGLKSKEVTSYTVEANPDESGSGGVEGEGEGEEDFEGHDGRYRNSRELFMRFDVDKARRCFRKREAEVVGSRSPKESAWPDEPPAEQPEESGQAYQFAVGADGIQASVLVDSGPHSGFDEQVYGLLLRPFPAVEPVNSASSSGEGSGAEAAAEDEAKRALAENVKKIFPENGMYGWFFCQKRSGWFRMGATCLPNGRFPFDIFSAEKTDDPFDGPTVKLEGRQAGLAEALIQRANTLRCVHRQAHHFYHCENLFTLPLDPASVPPRPKSMVEENMLAPAVDMQPKMSVYKCSQCNVAVYYDDDIVVPGVYPKELVRNLKGRDPLLHSTKENSFRRSLVVVFKLLTRILLGTESNPQLRTDRGGLAGSIGADDVGRQLMIRAGLELMQKEYPDEGLKSVYVISKSAEDRDWMVKLWVELRMLLHESRFKPGLMKPGELPMMWGIPGNGQPSLEENLAVSDALMKFVPLKRARFESLKRAAAQAKFNGNSGSSDVYRPIVYDTPLYRPKFAAWDKLVEPAARLGVRLADPCSVILSAFRCQISCHPHYTWKYLEDLEAMLVESDFLSGLDRTEIRSAVKSMLPTMDVNETKIMAALSTLDFSESQQTACKSLLALESQPHLLEFQDVVILQATARMSTIEDFLKSGAFTSKEEYDRNTTEIRQAVQCLATAFRLKAVEAYARDLQHNLEAEGKLLKKLQLPDTGLPPDDTLHAAYTAAKADETSESGQEELETEMEFVLKKNGRTDLMQKLGFKVEALPVPERMPAGLFNIGNTCYLNSLLQYLNSLATFRETVIALSKAEPNKQYADDLPRVGGRLLSLREVDRSWNFVKQLAHLFSTLSHTDSNAVRPERDLAYLALVTASDEKKPEEIVEKAQISTSGSDGTLVDEPMQSNQLQAESAAKQESALDTEDAVPVSSPRSGDSVLGKRSNEDRHIDNSVAASSEEPVATSPGDAERPTKNRRRSKSVESVNLGESSAPVPEVPAAGTENVPVAMMTPMEVDGPLTPPESPKEKSATLPVPPPLPPRHRSSVYNADMMFGQQHDISECLDNVLFQVEAVALTADSEIGEASRNIVKSLFYGKANQFIDAQVDPASDAQDVETPAASVDRKEADANQQVVFNSIYVSVRDDLPSDVYEKLAEVYFQPDEVELGGKTVRKVTTLEDLPPILQIQLERAQYDVENARAYKNDAYVKFDESLYLDRFLPSADPAGRERSQASIQEILKLRAKLAALKLAAPKPIAETIVDLKDALSAESENDETLATLCGLLELESDRLKSDIGDSEEQLQALQRSVNGDWSEAKTCEYELSSVFMHRGQAGFGHYWLYQRDLAGNPDDYYHFNDERVTKIDKTEVLKDTTGSNANPYLLVYVKKGQDMVKPITPVLGGGSAEQGSYGPDTGAGQSSMDIDFPDTLEIDPEL